MRSKLIAIALVASACAGSLNDPSKEAEILLTIRASFDRSTLPEGMRDQPLSAQLVWGAVPPVDRICLKYKDNAAMAPYCPSPFRFVRGAVETTADVGSDGAISLDIRRFPSADASVQNGLGRIAYGSVLVGGAEGPFLKTVVGASFANLTSDQERLSFREGDGEVAPFFYPMTGCTGIPLGFSVLRTAAWKAEPPRCEVASATMAVIKVAPITEVDSKSLQCPGGFGFVSPPQDEELPVIPGMPDRFCLDEETLVVPLDDGKGGCPGFQIFRLSGCFEDPFCTEPTWDLRQKKPVWWPC